jgi:hypothetical protein
MRIQVVAAVALALVEAIHPEEEMVVRELS